MLGRVSNLWPSQKPFGCDKHYVTIKVLQVKKFRLYFLFDLWPQRVKLTKKIKILGDDNKIPWQLKWNFPRGFKFIRTNTLRCFLSLFTFFLPFYIVSRLICCVCIKEDSLIFPLLAHSFYPNVFKVKTSFVKNKKKFLLIWYLIKPYDSNVALWTTEYLL